MQFSSIDNLTRAEAIREVRHMRSMADHYRAEALKATRAGLYGLADRLEKLTEKVENREAKIRYRYFL